MTVIRTTFTLAFVASLAACSGETPVRNGPQAVHPSPSALAQRGIVYSDDQATAAPATPDSKLDIGVAAFRDVCLASAPSFANAKAAAASYGVTDYLQLGDAAIGSSADGNLSVQIKPGTECAITTSSRGRANPATQFASVVPGAGGKAFPFVANINGTSFIIQHDRNGGEAFVMLKRK